MITATTNLNKRKGKKKMGNHKKFSNLMDQGRLLIANPLKFIAAGVRLGNSFFRCLTKFPIRKSLITKKILINEIDSTVLKKKLNTNLMDTLRNRE